MKVIQTRDRDRLEALLRTDSVWGGYGLADLEEPHFARTQWHLVEAPWRWAMVMSYSFGEHLTLMTFGDVRLLPSVLQEIPLPGSCDLHAHQEHLEAVSPLFDGRLTAYIRLGAYRHQFRPQAASVALDIQRLTTDGIPAARELYRHYPRNFFEPARVDEGLYVAARLGQRLVAVAGTHVVSPSYRVAAIGDIVVDPAYRGRGIGAAVTASLCEQLLAEADLVVLNVAADNLAARRCYEKLGFAGAVPHFEGYALRRRVDAVDAAKPDG